MEVLSATVAQTDGPHEIATHGRNRVGGQELIQIQFNVHRLGQLVRFIAEFDGSRRGLIDDRLGKLIRLRWKILQDHVTIFDALGVRCMLRD
jgi:hypothetical protein